MVHMHVNSQLTGHSTAATPCAQVCCHLEGFGTVSHLGLNIHTGQEHTAAATSGSGPGKPSYCTLPMFHARRNPNCHVNGLGYISNNGHLFECRNPVVMQQAFHV